MFLCLPVFSFGADFVTQLPFMAVVEQNTVHYNSAGKITEIYKTDTYEPYSVKNGDDIRIYLNSPFTIGTSSTALAVKYSFPDASYIEGQSYNLSFTVSSAKNYIYSYCNTINYTHNIPMTVYLFYANHDFNIGDTEFFPWQVNSKFNTLMNNYFENFLSSCVTTSNANVTSFSQDYTFSIDFCSEDEYSKSDNSIFFYFYFTTYGSTQLYYLNDFTLSPVGSTKSLFSEEEYQQGILSGINQFNEKLDELSSGLFNGGESRPPAISNQGQIDNFLQDEAALNKDFSADLNNQFNVAGNIFESNSSFSFISNLFQQLVLDVPALNSLIIFSLAIGLCVLILGRRLNA